MTITLTIDELQQIVQAAVAAGQVYQEGLDKNQNVGPVPAANMGWNRHPVAPIPIIASHIISLSRKLQDG